MCRIVEDIRSVTQKGSRFLVRLRAAQDIPHALPYISLYVHRDEDFSSWESLSYEEALHMGIIWSL